MTKTLMLCVLCGTLALAQPPEVATLEFNELFRRPVGRRGLEYSDKARALAGHRVQVHGFMVETDDPVPGVFLLAPFPINLHEHEYGLADDLPPSALHVVVPGSKKVVSIRHGPLVLTGVLELRVREWPDGRSSAASLVLDPDALIDK